MSRPLTEEKDHNENKMKYYNPLPTTTFKEFPPSQKVGSFSLDQVLETLKTGGGNK